MNRDHCYPDDIMFPNAQRLDMIAKHISR